MHVKSLLTVATVLCGLSAALDLEVRAPKGGGGAKGSKGPKGGSDGESSTITESSATETPTETATALGAEQTCANGWDCQNAANNARWCCGPTVACGSVDYSCINGEYSENGQCRARNMPDQAEFRWNCPNDWTCNNDEDTERDCIMNDRRRQQASSTVSAGSVSLTTTSTGTSISTSTSTSTGTSTTATGTAAANTQGSSSSSSTSATPRPSSSDGYRVVSSMGVVLGLTLAGLAWL